MRDRPDVEVEITPAMIEAGIGALMDHRVLDDHLYSAVVRAIYEAMQRARTLQTFAST